MLRRESSDVGALRRAASGPGWARRAWLPLMAIVVVAMMGVCASKQQLWEENDMEQPQVILSKIMNQASFLSKTNAWGAKGKSAFEPIRVAIYFNTGSTVRSYNSFMNVFSCYPDLVNVTRVRTLRFNNLNRENFDVLLIGGGSAQAIQEYHEITHKIKLDRVIKNFLAQGGGYVGVCAGAYLAGRYRLSAFESDRTGLGEGAMHDVKLESMLDILELSKSLPMSLMELPWFYANGPFLRNRKDLGTTQNVQQGTCLAHFADSGKLDIYRVKRKASRNVHYQGDTNVCLLGHNLYGNGTVISSTGHPEVEVDILDNNLTVNSTQCGTQQAYAIMNMIALAASRSTSDALPAVTGLRRPSRPEPEISLKDLEEFDNTLKKWENFDPTRVDMNEYALQRNDGQIEDNQARWTIEQD